MKCKGDCGRESRGDGDSMGGYGSFFGDKLLEWICDECWGKGIRYSEPKEKKFKKLK